jgi:hypothetical protein
MIVEEINSESLPETENYNDNENFLEQSFSQ